jgi:hypothetical protein
MKTMKAFALALLLCLTAAPAARPESAPTPITCRLHFVRAHLSVIADALSQCLRASVTIDRTAGDPILDFSASGTVPEILSAFRHALIPLTLNTVYEPDGRVRIMPVLIWLPNGQPVPRVNRNPDGHRITCNFRSVELVVLVKFLNEVTDTRVIIDPSVDDYRTLDFVTPHEDSAPEVLADFKRAIARLGLIAIDEPDGSVRIVPRTCGFHFVAARLSVVAHALNQCLRLANARAQGLSLAGPPVIRFWISAPPVPASRNRPRFWPSSRLRLPRWV